MTSPTASSARSLVFWLRYLDARLLRRHWCESCRKTTVLDHRHTVRFEHILRSEWRDS